MKENDDKCTDKCVSVILPVYNVENYIKKCLESIILQSYQNIEIILVDDGSTDKSGEICDKIRKTDGRITVIHQANSGVSVARNIGLKHCNGDAVLFLDPDDIIEKNMIEKMVNVLFSKNVSVVCCGYINEFSDNKITNIPPEGIIEQEEALIGLFRVDIMSVVWNKMFRRDALLDENGEFIFFHPDICIGEDFLWLIRIFAKCKSFYGINEAYYHWMRRETSATGNNEVRIDQRSLTEVAALEQVTELCRVISPLLFHTACKRYYGLLMLKLKIADLKDDRVVSEMIRKKLSNLLCIYPKQTLKERIKLLKAQILIKCSGNRKLCLFIEGKLCAKRCIRGDHK